MKRIMWKLMVLAAAMMVMFCSSSSGTDRKTCIVSGCNKSAAGGSLYCSTHKCKHSDCNNLGMDDGYCRTHAKKTSSSGSRPNSDNSGSRRYTSKRCIVTGCNNTRSGNSSYCTKHKCSASGCRNKADASGYCAAHHYKAGDPFDVYNYDHPDDFYYDRRDDFLDYEDAEEYWYDAWD